MRCADGRAHQIFYIPVNITNAGIEARDNSQRTRSFLFACLALAVARMFDRDRFVVYENGVVSINLPITRDVLARVRPEPHILGCYAALKPSSRPWSTSPFRLQHRSNG